MRPDRGQAQETLLSLDIPSQSCKAPVASSLFLTPGSYSSQHFTLGRGTGHKESKCHVVRYINAEELCHTAETT